MNGHCHKLSHESCKKQCTCGIAKEHTDEIVTKHTDYDAKQCADCVTM